jgi:tetratricopeptide (TPR) repeat protein
MDEQREQDFLEVLRVFPDDALTRFGLGNLYRDAGRIDEAIAQYQKTVEIDPGYGAAYLELGTLQEQAGQIDDARLTYKLAIANAEKKGDLHIVNRARMRLEDLA